jgi:hypothetical protein
VNKFKRFTYEVKYILVDIWNGSIPPSEISDFFSSLAGWFWDGTFFLNIVNDGETVALDRSAVKR